MTAKFVSITKRQTIYFYLTIIYFDNPLTNLPSSYSMISKAFNYLILLSLLCVCTISVNAANAAQTIITNNGINPSNKAFLAFNSEAGESYEVHRSSDLAQWQGMKTFSGTDSTLTWVDPEPLTGKHFFRVASIQTSGTNLATGDTLTVTQSWSQESNYARTATVSVPAGPGPHPVVIALHGNGGNSGFANSFGYLNQMIRIGPQGYLNSWNIKSEQSKAPDVNFIRDLILQLRTYDNVDAGRIILIGSSNGAALVNRLLIELDGALFQEAIKLVGQMNANQFNNGQFWYNPTGTNSYNTSIAPAYGRRILSLTGTNDILVPYTGGNGVLGYNFLHAGESIYQFAKQMGYTGSKIPEANGVLFNTDIYKYSYLGGAVVMYKLIGGDHGLNPFTGAQGGQVGGLIKHFLGHP